VTAVWPAASKALAAMKIRMAMAGDLVKMLFPHCDISCPRFPATGFSTTRLRAVLRGIQIPLFVSKSLGNGV
jgi:hypothetical protein